MTQKDDVWRVIIDLPRDQREAIHFHLHDERMPIRPELEWLCALLMELNPWERDEIMLKLSAEFTWRRPQRTDHQLSLPPGSRVLMVIIRPDRKQNREPTRLPAERFRN